MICRRTYLSDQRRFQRYQCNLTVWCKVQEPLEARLHFGDKEFEATALNVCEAGAGLLSDHRIPEHAVISLTMVISKGNSSGEVRWEKPLQVTGKVCYSRPSEEANRYRLGVCFTEVPSEYKNRLTNFLSVSAV
jgi:hypothetical protein